MPYSIPCHPPNIGEVVDLVKKDGSSTKQNGVFSNNPCAAAEVTVLVSRLIPLIEEYGMPEAAVTDIPTSKLEVLLIKTTGEFDVMLPVLEIGISIP